MAKQLNVNLAFTADTSQAKAQIQSLQQSLNNLVSFKSGVGLQPGVSAITSELVQASQAAAQLKIALSQATDVNTGKINLNTLNTSMKKAGLTLSQVRTSFNALGTEGQQAFLKLASAIQTADAPLLSLKGKLKTLTTTLANTARWQVASTALNTIVTEVSEAYQYAQNLDKSLNDIRIVSGASADEMADFAKSANKAAQSLSTTTKKYADAALIFYQQGK